MQGWTREETHSTTIAAGVDVAKLELVVAVTGSPEILRFGNDATGHDRLRHELTKLVSDGQPLRVGMEASGGYERKLAAALRKAGFAVFVFQPSQVKAFGDYLGKRAKTDPLDARLIALCTAAHSGEARQVDDRLAELAEHLTLVEQMEQDIARLKTRREGFTAKACKDDVNDEIKRLKLRRTAALKHLLIALRRHKDLAQRLSLLFSIQGIGERTALTLAIRMPELGTLTREQAASLTGLAPFDKQSGKLERSRHISGGRAKVRRSLYAAALPAAFAWNPALVDLYKRLVAKGKNHKQALTACARKLVVFANAVLQRGTPWTKIDHAL